jgi:Ca2+-binding RTX toxin-like protein
LSGDSGHAKLYGGKGADTMYGDSGNDTLFSGAGADTMTGGSGHDTFVFQSIVGGSDTITDFHHGGSSGDVLNITDILKGFHLGTSVAANFIHIHSNGDGTSTLQVNPDGKGSDLHDVAHLNLDLSGVSVDSLIADGTIVVNQHLV